MISNGYKQDVPTHPSILIFIESKITPLRFSLKRGFLTLNPPVKIEFFIVILK
jgi:hypothetical protein